MIEASSPLNGGFAGSQVALGNLPAAKLNFTLSAAVPKCNLGTRGKRILIRRRHLLAGFLSALALSSVTLFDAGAAVITFGSASDIDTYFTATGAAKFSSVINGGISGSSAIAPDAEFSAGTLVTRASLQGGASNPLFSASVYFRFSSPTSDAGGYMLTLGLANSPTFDISASNKNDNELGISKQAFSSDYTAFVLSYTNGSGGGNGSGVTFQNGGWYRLSLNAAWDSSTSRYDIQYQVNQSDSSGAIGSVLFSQVPAGAFGINPLDSIYAFISASGPSGAMGVAVVDNFFYTPVPEPSAASLLILGMLSMIARRQSHGRERVMGGV